MYRVSIGEWWLSAMITILINNICISQNVHIGTTLKRLFIVLTPVSVVALCPVYVPQSSGRDKQRDKQTTPGYLLPSPLPFTLCWF